QRRDIVKVGKCFLHAHGPRDIAWYQHDVVVPHDAGPTFEEGTWMLLPRITEDGHRLGIGSRQVWGGDREQSHRTTSLSGDAPIRTTCRVCTPGHAWTLWLPAKVGAAHAEVACRLLGACRGRQAREHDAGGETRQRVNPGLHHVVAARSDLAQRYEREAPLGEARMWQAQRLSRGLGWSVCRVGGCVHHGVAN